MPRHPPILTVQSLPSRYTEALSRVRFASAVVLAGAGVGAIGAPVSVLASHLGAVGAAEARVARASLGLDAAAAEAGGAADGIAGVVRRRAESGKSLLGAAYT